jgi:radical SAM superfamily enzyme YgiQ (UPF0313 family)
MSGRPVCLVQPPVSFDNPAPCLDDKQYGLGLLALSAWLQRHGFAVAGIHAPLALHAGSNADDVCREIVALDPLLIAIGLNWVHFSQGAIELAGKLREKLPSCPIVLGGQHATLFASEIASQHADCVDGVIRGEAEIPLLELSRMLQAHGRIVRDIPGLVTPDRNPDACAVTRIDDLPVYSYTSLHPAPLRRDVAALSTTRGPCPFACSWCVEPVVGRLQGRKKLQFHSARHIAEQIAALLDEGIDRFTIQDNFFVGGDKNLIALSDELLRRGIRPKHMNVFAHPDSFGSEGLQALAACCLRASIDYGVETGSVRVAALNGRDMDPVQVTEQMRITVDAGVEPYTWWMVGLPGEDFDALSETEDLILQTMHAGGVPRWVSPLILFPKTPIHADAERYAVQPRFTTFQDYTSFSRTTLAEAVLFGDAIAHRTAQATRQQIVDASQRLRRFIIAHLDVLTKFYRQQHLRPDLAAVQSRVAQSFF